MHGGSDTPPARIAIKRQRVVGTRRRYNQWVNNQTLEDYALRFTALKARRWSAFWVANTALGSIAFLACEALGATVTLSYGFDNMLLALGVAAAIFLIAGFPICYYGARYGVDMDLLTRGAGFGYLGSTITSAVYASFTFILFAIEAIILSAALELCFGIPLAIGHIISALIIMPIAAYGFRRISSWQNWTQPIWLILQFSAVVYLFSQGDEAVRLWTGFEGSADVTPMLSFGAALAIFLSLLPQIGEQVDYLRFLPQKDNSRRGGWWAALLFTGPGWIIVGGIKILIGSWLAVIAIDAGMDESDAANPSMLYYMTFSGLSQSVTGALILTALFVAICQIKINVTNAYAGSIASSNFFSRLTHRHPGRVVWLFFNVVIALMLMEGGIQNVVERVLAFYSNFAVAWFGAVVADLMISKPLGLSPKGIEFRRAYLYDVNPVGVSAMFLSLLTSSFCLAGAFGETIRAFSPLIGLGVAFVAAPLMAAATRGRYYIARQPATFDKPEIRCTVCENEFEQPDMAHCPVYEGAICSLCCTLEARCHDACKERSHFVERTTNRLSALLPASFSDNAYARIVRFFIAFVAGGSAISLLLLLIFYQQIVDMGFDGGIGRSLSTAWIALLTVTAFAAWYFVLARESQHASEEETERQTGMLMEEIEAHARTDQELQRAKEVAESANLAKSRYLVGVSHEIRTPLNTILGYAQLAERDPALHGDDAIAVIRRSATHLADLVDGLVDISAIENGTLRIERNRVNLHLLLDQIVGMFRLPAAAAGIRFDHQRADNLPQFVFTDEKRLRQVLINLCSNAIKYTPEGTASLNVGWRSPFVEFEVKDSGVGIAEEYLERIFEPFDRAGAPKGTQGVGLGLTITHLLVKIMGGQLTVDSEPGVGSSFRVKLFLSESGALDGPEVAALRTSARPRDSRSIMLVDDDPTHLDLMRAVLAPLNFELSEFASGETALEAFATVNPDLVILDIAMPGLDGWQTAHAIRAMAGDDLPILMVSANVHDFQRRRRDDDPHDDYLVKPYDVDALVERIDLLLSLKEPGK